MSDLSASSSARLMLRFSASVRDQATLTSFQAGSLLVDKRMSARLANLMGKSHGQISWANLMGKSHGQIYGQISWANLWNGAPHEQQIPALLARHGERRLFRHACVRAEHG